jgi:Gluconate 2-dehydrogenase subunit 3
MNRRELLRNSLLAMGVLAVNPRAGARIFTAGEDAFDELARVDWTPGFLNAQQNEALIVLSDAIIPATDTPGAKAALVNRFLDLIIAAEPANVQTSFLDALAWFDTASQERYQKTFVNLTGEERQGLLNLVAWPHTHARWGKREKGFAGYEHFSVMKRWIVSAFYSSPVGLKEQGWDGWAARGTFTGCEHEAGEHQQEDHKHEDKSGDHAE